jgi:hypothetical protein
MMEHRSRLSLASTERQTLQLHAMTGTPSEVPVPNMVTLIDSDLLDLLDYWIKIQIKKRI